MKTKLTIKHYLKLVRKDLYAIAALGGTDPVRFKKLKRRSEKNLQLAKDLELKKVSKSPTGQ